MNNAASVTSSLCISLACVLSDLLCRKVNAEWSCGRWEVVVSTSTVAWFTQVAGSNDCLLMIETCIDDHYDLASIPVPRSARVLQIAKLVLGMSAGFDSAAEAAEAVAA
jgi:hypothetical protein